MPKESPSFLSIEILRTMISAVCEHRSVARVEVFGSVARGTADARSDVDLLVEFMPGAKVGLFEMGSLKEDLEEKLGRKVDLLSRRAVEKSQNPYRRRAILDNPVTLYAR